jgi:hypothetical protein
MSNIACNGPCGPFHTIGDSLKCDKCGEVHPKLVCPECGGPVDKDGDTTHPSHCSECVCYSGNEPECKTCGFFPCDSSC